MGLESVKTAPILNLLDLSRGPAKSPFADVTLTSVRYFIPPPASEAGREVTYFIKKKCILSYTQGGAVV